MATKVIIVDDDSNFADVYTDITDGAQEFSLKQEPGGWMTGLDTSLTKNDEKLGIAVQLGELDCVPLARAIHNEDTWLRFTFADVVRDLLRSADCWDKQDMMKVAAEFEQAAAKLRAIPDEKFYHD